MKRTHWIVGAWLLLLVPTLLIGALALRLLHKEQDHLAESKVQAIRQQAAVVAENLDLAVAEVKDGLLASLRRLPPTDLERRLEDWRLSNPLVRNVFIWTPEGLQWPDPATPIDAEAGAFAARYRALFSGRLPWRPPRPERLQRQIGSANGSGNFAEKTVFASRKALRQLAQDLGDAQSTPSASGWLPWFWEDGLYLLGWLEDSAGRRYGLEMEMTALLSRLVTSLPAPPANQAYTLVDGRGNIVHRTGAAASRTDLSQLAVLPIGPDLPHWQLQVFAPADFAAGKADGGLLLLSALLVGCFVAAVLFGGSLLLWQAWRHMLDARRKTSFVSNVSHELKTPLTTIRMYAELLGEGKIKDAAKRQRYLQVIIAESLRLTRLVNNVLDFSRLEQRRKQYHLTALYLDEILEEVLDGQGMRLQQADLTLERRIPTGVPTIRGDRDAIEQVLLNLIDNAIKYAAAGGELVVELGWAGQTVEVLLKDRGPGVPASEQKRIFNQFHRVDNALTCNSAGCGLGLSIARRLLRDLHGELRYRPRDGGGACFVMELPVDEDAERSRS